ncbi:hypothetical protein VNO78_16773 [Psophocarpus tetragonolobus]|uniref:Secreted protein n=1 Tax=Psophocarpus tetragonolobus TaxID=3891 RepID=A0AAN9SLV2_PSOTE
MKLHLISCALLVATDSYTTFASLLAFPNANATRLITTVLLFFPKFRETLHSTRDCYEGYLCFIYNLQFWKLEFNHKWDTLYMRVANSDWNCVSLSRYPLSLFSPSAPLLCPFYNMHLTLKLPYSP